MVERFRRTFSLNNLIDAARASTVKPSPTVQVYNVIGQFHGCGTGTAHSWEARTKAPTWMFTNEKIHIPVPPHCFTSKCIHTQL